MFVSKTGLRLAGFILIFCFSFSASAQILPDTIANETTGTQKVLINNINIIGNKRTKESIVLRELVFLKNDSVILSGMDSILNRSKENLLNTSLFNFVTVNYVINQSGEANIFIFLAERWYTFPLPIFELVDRNFNEWWKTKDFSRTNYGVIVVQNNFRGRNETIGFSLRLGYTQRVGISYSIPAIDKDQKNGLGFAFSYQRLHEINAITRNNETFFIKDDTKYLRKEYGGAVGYVYRKGHDDRYSAQVEFKKNEVDDTVLFVNKKYFLNQKTTERYFGISIFYEHDVRDSKDYPLKGSYFDIGVVKTGIGFLKDDVNIISIGGSYKKYFPLSNRFNFAAGINGKLSGNELQPYFHDRALGYGNNFVRGYEYYVVDGQRFILLKANFKYVLIQPHVLKFGKYLPEKFASVPYAFYLNIFSDAGYAYQKYPYDNNNLVNTWLPGYGAGIDFVTYYSVVLRAEYSINKFGEKGIFIHFSVPI